ncbi:MAG: hypothetical protein ACE5I5_20635 [Candidatus Heimdallarchaeota archaeon]
MVLHANIGDLELTEQMKQLNPNMGLIICSGKSEMKKEARTKFPDAYHLDVIPNERRLHDILTRLKQEYGCHSS